MSEPTDKSPISSCPCCGSAEYKQNDVASFWLGMKILLCDNCGYSEPAPGQVANTESLHASAMYKYMRDEYIKKWNAKLGDDPRITSVDDDREAKPL